MTTTRSAAEHSTSIETEIRPYHAHRAGDDLDRYHRYICSCGVVGHWGHSFFADNSVASAENTARQHVFNALNVRNEGNQ